MHLGNIFAKNVSATMLLRFLTNLLIAFALFKKSKARGGMRGKKQCGAFLTYDVEEASTWQKNIGMDFKSICVSFRTGSNLRIRV